MISTVEQLREFLRDYERIYDKLEYICSEFMWGNTEPFDMHYEVTEKCWHLSWTEYCSGENIRHFRKVPFDWLLKTYDELNKLILDILVKEMKQEESKKKREERAKQKAKEDEERKVYEELKKKFERKNK